MDASTIKNRKALRKIGEYQFGVLLQDNGGWIHKGDDLMICATVLRKELWRQRKAFDKAMDSGEREFHGMREIELRMAHMEGPISLLLAYAFENYLKGIWILHNPSHSGTDRKLPKHFRDDSHNLVAHAETLEIALNPEEREVLMVLSEFSTWRGRYPIALNASLNGDAWSKTGNLNLISSKYPGPNSWPDAVVSILGKFHEILSPPLPPHSQSIGQ